MNGFETQYHFNQFHTILYKNYFDLIYANFSVPYLIYDDIVNEYIERYCICWE